VSIVLHEDPQVHENRTLTATADCERRVREHELSPEQHHIGVRFILTATGAASGKQAQTTFTDGTGAGSGSMAGTSVRRSWSDGNLHLHLQGAERRQTF
jgi:hypothetical protein